MNLLPEVKRITDSIIKSVNPQKIYLFGSFARGEQTIDSDIDFYVVLHDNSINAAAAQDKINFERPRINRAVDILARTNTDFNNRAVCSVSLEHVVSNEGILVYGG